MPLPTERQTLAPSPETRRCKACSAIKPIEAFHSHITSGKRYWAHKCKECVKPEARERKKAWYAKDPERARNDSRRWYENNREAAMAAASEYKALNAEWWKEYHRTWRAKNTHKILHWVRQYQSAKLRAMPAWANRAAILAVYEKADEMRKAGVPCEVDHVVPLRSKLVCGLHVEFNLAIVPPAENNLKGNRSWPDMP
jgi:hypothetical protein